MLKELEEQGQTKTFGGSRLSRTSSVWEIKFEKRGPIATYSNNLHWCMKKQLMLCITEQLQLNDNKRIITKSYLSMSSRTTTLNGDLYASSKTCKKTLDLRIYMTQQTS